MLTAGRLVATAGVSRWMGESTDNAAFVQDSLRRHLNCDWGELCEDDAELNNRALQDGDRVLSAYSIGSDKIWIITESDRSVTTVLFPSEY